MIRIAKLEDIDQGIDLLNENIKKYEYAKNWTQDNTDYYRGLLTNCIKDGTVVVSVDEDNNINGTLIGIVVPNMWNIYVKQLHIITTWVHEDKRGSSIFYRMHNEMNKIAKEKQVSDLLFYHEQGSTNVNYTKLGYKGNQTIYTKEIK